MTSLTIFTQKRLIVKSLITSLLMLIASHYSLAQTSATITSYFDKDWKVVSDPSKAAYYRTVEQTIRGYLVRDYYISGKLQMEAECLEVSPDLENHGKFATYYENGNKKEEGMYNKDKRAGVFKSYYENGNAKDEVEYLDNDTRYLHYWSETGEDELADGEAVIKIFSGDQYDNYQFIRGFKSINSFGINRSSGDTVYMVVEKQPEYPGGYNEMMNDIRKTLKYPVSARRSGASGTVYVSFVINKLGEMKDMYVIRGFDPDCDVAALEAVAKLKNWIPGRLKEDFYGNKDKVVSVRFVLPIKFSLSDKRR